MLHFLLRLFKNVVACVYPSLCFNCRRLIPQNERVCQSCWLLVKPIVTVYLPLADKRNIPIFAVTSYTDPLKKLITAKFRRSPLAACILADIMLQALPSCAYEIDYIVPIPLHWVRFFYRGYNQAAVIANRIGKMKKVPVLKCLRRVKKTAYQYTLGLPERHENLKNAFILKQAHRDLIKGKKILLVDDLYTTGSTIKAAAKLLYKAGAIQVIGAVACRSQC